MLEVGASWSCISDTERSPSCTGSMGVIGSMLGLVGEQETSLRAVAGISGEAQDVSKGCGLRNEACGTKMEVVSRELSLIFRFFLASKLASAKVVGSGSFLSFSCWSQLSRLQSLHNLYKFLLSLQELPLLDLPMLEQDESLSILSFLAELVAGSGLAFLLELPKESARDSAES